MNSKSIRNNYLISFLIYIGTILIPFKEIFSTGAIVYFVTFIIVVLFFLNNGIRVKNLFILLMITLIFIFDALLFGYHKEIIDLYINFLKFGFLYYWFITSIEEINPFFTIYYKVSLFALAIILLKVFVLTTPINYMSLGVDLSYISAAVLYKIKFLKNNIWDKLLIILILLFCMIYANRMSLLTILLMCLLTIFYDRKSIVLSKRIFQDVLLISFFSFLWLSYEKIINYFWDFLVSKGINSYSLFKLKFMIENKNTDIITSGRDSLYDFAINTIKENHFLPVGFGYISAHTDFKYPHNIILEMLLDFGFAGFFILIIIIVFIVFGLTCSNKENKFVILLFSIFSLSRLLVSSSFWIETSLWVTFGFVVNNILRGTKKE